MLQDAGMIEQLDALDPFGLVVTRYPLCAQVLGVLKESDLPLLGSFRFGQRDAAGQA